MKTKNKLCSIALASTALVLFLILISSTASATTEQNASSTGAFAYITNYCDDNISIINTTTNTVTATVNVGTRPVGIAVTPDGKSVYVVNELSDNVSVINTTTNTVTATVNVGTGPVGAAVTPDGKSVYVANSNIETVSVINTTTNTVTATVPVGSFPMGVAVNPEGTKVYVANEFDDTISVIDTATNTVTTTVNVGSCPEGVAVNPEGTKVYVTNTYSNTTSVIDTATNEVTATVKVGFCPEGIAVNPAGTKVYVTNSDSDDVSVIDTSTNNVTATVPVGNGPTGVAVNPDGTKVYVTNSDSDDVSVIDTSTNNVTATVPVGNYPVAFGQFIGYVSAQPVLPTANFSSNVTEGYAPLTVQFTDLSTNATSWNWDFGDGANSTEQNPTHTYYAVGNYTVNLTVTNENGTNSTLATITVSEKPVPASDWEFSPQEPVSGETLNINGNASPKEKVDVFVTFEKTIPVSKGKFEYNLKDVKIPEGFNNYFTVEAIGAKNLNVRVKMVLWVTKSSEASEDTAIVSQSSVPPGTYKIKIDGNAGEGVSEVNLKITAFQGIKADSNGNFSYSYNTKAVPPGDFEIKVGGITKEITIKPKGIDKPGTVIPVADFSANTTEGFAPLLVQFNDGSKNATSVNWDFNGDGIIDSEELNPIHEFTTPGTYTVTLTASNANGKASRLATITVLEQEQPVLPVANFSTNITEGYAPLSVQFNDSSENATGWNWDFGNGVNSTEQNPTHTYSAAGNYTVNLTTSNGNGTDSKLATINVSEQPVAVLPVANFSTSVTIGSVPLSVQFTDLSENVTEWNWNFGDGANSVEQNPMHTYSTEGNYTVTLTANNSAGSNTVTKYNYITVVKSDDAIIEGHAPLSVQFTDLSEGATSWKWSFGDGSISTEQNPTHTYSKPGQYTVTLTANNMAGSNVITKYTYISVTNSLEVPVDAFSVSATSGKAPLNISFTDKSTGLPDSWKWNFGDGNTSTEQNPTHTYSKPGQYTVTLTVNNVAGSSVVTKYSYISVANSMKVPVADFSASTFLGKVPLNISY